MFCSRCGKKVLEYMLFCPFCGTEIVIPEQDDAPAATEAVTVPARTEAEKALEPAPQERTAPEAPREEPVPERFSAARPRHADSSWMDEALNDVEEELPAEPVKAEPLEVEPEAEGVDFMDDDGDLEDNAYGHGLLEKEEERASEPMYYRMKEAEAEPAAEPEAEPEIEAGEPERRVPELRRRREKKPEREARPQARRKKSEMSGRKRPTRGEALEKDDRTEDGLPDRGRRSADTHVPEKPIKAEDIFMDDVADAEDDYDDYDAYDDSYEATYEAVKRRRAKYDEDDDDLDDDDFDDLEKGGDKGSFLIRHIRGIVGMILFLVLILVLILYFLSDSGQKSLAHINATLPLKSDIYAGLAYESYQSGDFRQAGVYYERALARSPDNYTWASSAAMAYIADENVDKAVEMLKKCIEIKPLAPEPYYYLLEQYPDASSRPWEITQLLQQGYQTTGDETLNVKG